MTEEKFDVFLSHNFRDKAWVRSFYELLRSHGLSVFFDEVSIKYGDDLTGKIDEGILNSSCILLVVSKRSLASGWVAFELSSALYLNIKEKDRRLIPIFLEHIEDDLIRPSLSRLNSVYLTSIDDREHNIRKLLSEIGVRNANTINLPESILRLEEAYERMPDTISPIENEIRQIREIQSIESSYNIAVVGKAGVGKSSLINYLLGKPVRETGTGLPVTEQGFHRIDFSIDGTSVALFDSGGLNVDNANTWLQTLNSELRSRGADKPIQEWFHTILYCISASELRVDEFEIQTIKKFVEQRYKVTVVLTKADLSSKEDIKILTEVIASSSGVDIECVPVCSDSKELMIGRTQRFGIEVLQASIQGGFQDSIVRRIPKRCIGLLIDLISTWSAYQTDFIDSEHPGYSQDEMIPYLKKEAEDLITKLSGDEVIGTINSEINTIISAHTRFSHLINLKLKENIISIDIPSLKGMKFSALVGAGDFFSIIGLGIAVAFIGVSIPLTLALTAPAATAMAMQHNRKKKKLKELVREFSTSLKRQVRLLEPAISDEIRQTIV